MDMDNYNELMIQYALSNDNYQNWRRVHTNIFGNLFSDAFADSPEAQIHLTAALNNISQRNFLAAVPKLLVLDKVCASEFDRAVTDYFMGLNNEMMGNEEQMNTCYERLADSDCALVFPLALHPYYRTAKFAQRDSECQKAVYYYRKALSLYDGRTPDSKILPSVGQIIYDVATVCLYMHEYDECERFLELSEKYDASENQQRIYVKAMLYAVRGRKIECEQLLDKLNPILRASCEKTVNAVFAKRELHYYAVLQDRSRFDKFWNYISRNRKKLEVLISQNKKADVQNLLTKKLSQTMPFMNLPLDCLVESDGSLITVRCKNYCVRTLQNEYNALFSQKPELLVNWNFVSVDSFEEDKYV